MENDIDVTYITSARFIISNSLSYSPWVAIFVRLQNTSVEIFISDLKGPEECSQIAGAEGHLLIGPGDIPRLQVCKYRDEEEMLDIGRTRVII